MSNDDSFNDSDEIFNLYSSKNVTETFKAQLKKIVENSNNLTKAFSHVNNEEITSKREKNTSGRIPVVSKKQEVNSAPRTTTKKLNMSSEVCEECTLDDSIEVIKELTPNSTRKSERLGKKRAESGVKFKDSSDVDPDVRVIKQITQRRRQKPKGKKQKKGGPVDEIILGYSPQPPDVEDELNPEISVKVIWKSVNVKKFMIRKFQKLSCIFESLSKEENIPEDKIILTFNNIIVNPNDTPDSLNLQVYHFLDGGVLSESTNLCPTVNSHAVEAGRDFVTLKFQDVNKKIITVNINKNDKLKVGMIMCSEQLEIPLYKIRFFFDGELLEPSETPGSLGLENEEIIDIKTI